MHAQCFAVSRVERQSFSVTFDQGRTHSSHVLDTKRADSFGRYDVLHEDVGGRPLPTASFLWKKNAACVITSIVRWDAAKLVPGSATAAVTAATNKRKSIMDYSFAWSNK